MKFSLETLRPAIAFNPKDSPDPLAQVKASPGSFMFLGYYRNAVGRVFAAEGMVVCCLSKHRGVDKGLLKAEVEYLRNLLVLEYFIPAINVDETLRSLKRKKVIVETAEHSFELAKEHYWEAFLGSFVWPFIECYWGLLLYFNELLATKVRSDFAYSKVISALIL